MPFDPNLHHRRSIRIPGYDYSRPGGYFVTLVTHRRACLFGEVDRDKVNLNALGEIVFQEWFRSAEIRKEISLFEDEFIVMPNHVHGIVWMVDDPVGADGVRPGCPAEDTPIHPQPLAVNKMGAHRASLQRTPRSLSSLIAGYKASVTSRARRELGLENIWQRNFYEHILRTDEDAHRIYLYIQDNPFRWADDEENPLAHPGPKNGT